MPSGSRTLAPAPDRIDPAPADPDRAEAKVEVEAKVKVERAEDGRSEVDVELAARLRVAIARLSRQLRQQAGTGLSPTLQSVVATIALHGPLPLGELAQREQVAPPTITKLLARLDEQGLIERQRGADDKRVTLVSLTVKGRRQFDQSRTRRTAWLVRRLGQLDHLDETQLLVALQLLEALVEPEPITTGRAR